MKKLLVIFLLLWSSLGFTQNHRFWDGIENFDGPTDDNPLLAAQIDYYFDKMVAPLPDSIELEISRLISKTENNKDLRDFILWHLLHKYQHPDYMTQDQVFVFLYDEYFSQLEIKDLYDNNLALIHEKAERLRRLALFCPAPEISIEGIGLQSIESEYTVLFFYDHDCDVCRQEMQVLDSICAVHPEIMVLAIDMNIDSLGGFVVSSQEKGDLKSPIQHRRIANPSELLSLSDAYDIETMPLLYVLDRDKRILAKKLQACQIPMILN